MSETQNIPLSELLEFLYRASHDLRGPLMSVEGLVNLAQMEVEDEKAKLYFAMISERVNRLDKIFVELIRSSEIFNHQVEYGQVDFIQILNDAKESLPVLSKYPNFEITQNLSSDLKFNSDAKLLKQIFISVIENAVAYRDQTKASNHVNITISKASVNELSIVFEDNGQGMLDIVKDKVFNMFYRGNNNSVGLGLGLYFVKKIADILGGFVELQSVVDKGTMIKFTFPAN